MFRHPDLLLHDTFVASTQNSRYYIPLAREHFNWNDILSILKIQALTLNLAYLDQQAKEMGVDELLSQALIDAGIHGEEPSSSFQKKHITVHTCPKAQNVIHMKGFFAEIVSVAQNIETATRFKNSFFRMSMYLPNKDQ